MYNPFDWYWLADDGRLFSSAAEALVASNDRDYLAWRQTGIHPTRWPVDDAGNQTDEALQEVLQPYAIHVGLAFARAALINEVNSAAEAERKRYITAGEGQAMTYTEKLAQARAFLAATAPDPADYPMIANEVGITASNVAGVAEAVVAAYTAWAAIGAAIEKTRMEANKAITAAADAAEARAIRNNVVWPTAG